MIYIKPVPLFLEEYQVFVWIPINMDVDQMVDLDGFARQVASVRGVLTISNTTAHLAGALGIPCVVILDNGSITNWPDVGDTTPLYPATRLIRRGSDDWVTALKRGWRMLKVLISPQ